MNKNYLINNELISLENIKKSKQYLSFTIQGQTFDFVVKDSYKNEITIAMNGKNYQMDFHQGLCRLNGKQYHIEKEQVRRGSSAEDELGSLKSPMPGKVLKLAVNIGDIVTKGTTLLVMEAMKMEHSLKAPCDCTVDKFFFKEGELVVGDIELVAITPKEST